MNTVIDRQLAERWSKLISTMNVPVERQTATVPNLRWFLRNGQLLNGSHKDIFRARELTIKILDTVE